MKAEREVGRMSGSTDTVRRVVANQAQWVDQVPFIIEEPLPIIGQSREAEEIRRFIRLHADAVQARVLIGGKTGTGKELLARHLHILSPRRRAPFVAINCAAIAGGLVESHLFGHVKGAFTGADRNRKGCFELAHRGTLVLDEIGELPLEIQAKLLRALEDSLIFPVGAELPILIDVRIVAATNRDLDQRVREGLFRQDLLYRLRTAEIILPELRARSSDVPELGAAFLKSAAARFARSLRCLSENGTKSLIEYDWPGNIRELQHEMERLTLVGGGPIIAAEELHPRILGITSKGTLRGDPETESEQIVRLLGQYAGNRQAVAQAMGIGRSTLWRKMREYGIRHTFGQGV